MVLHPPPGRLRDGWLDRPGSGRGPDLDLRRPQHHRLPVPHRTALRLPGLQPLRQPLHPRARSRPWRRSTSRARASSRSAARSTSSRATSRRTRPGPPWRAASTARPTASCAPPWWPTAPRACVRGAGPEPIDFETQHLELHARPTPGRFASEGAIDTSLRVNRIRLPLVDAALGNADPADLALDATVSRATSPRHRHRGAGARGLAPGRRRPRHRAPVPRQGRAPAPGEGPPRSRRGAPAPGPARPARGRRRGPGRPGHGPALRGREGRADRQPRRPAPRPPQPGQRRGRASRPRPTMPSSPCRPCASPRAA